MKVYLAGISVSKPKKEKRLCELFHEGHKLHSFYHCVTGFEKKWFKMNIKNKVDLFLDSGAVSAWSKDIKIDIQEYISFIKKNKKVIGVYANLDVIGNPKKTLKNQKIMEKAGLNPVPTFHMNSDVSFLKYYVENYDYVALGGMAGIGTSTEQLRMWLDDIFSKYICDPGGMPKVKIHGFGMTSFSLLIRYPWYSVDSTSWVITGRMGSIYVPLLRDGEYIYDEACMKIAVSNRSPNLKKMDQHISTLSPIQKETVLQYIKHKGYQLGISSFKKIKQDRALLDNEKWTEKKPDDSSKKRLVEIIEEPGISNKYELRDEMNIIYYLDFEKGFPKWPWAFKKNEIMEGFF